MHLKNTDFGIRKAGSLEVYLWGTSPFVLPTSPPHRLSSLPEAVKCVVLILSIQPIHIQNVVSILAYISSFASVQLLWTHHEY